MGHWYSRPVLFVSNVERAIRFYVDQLGFSEGWRYEDETDPVVAQVARAGTELLFSSQWPDKVGRGLIFISLEAEDLSAVRAEFENAGVEIKSGWWGYPLMIIEDPDGNELYIPCNAEKGMKGELAEGG
ncbi:MAG TPA: glyoxalase superfamily protein [Sphingomicrobium sp.]|jgi:catechol 2,3-dioxygenase-like lactoylglutathione lyase family enzyme|nr:glyoxalase superfamily protein [Sphingomicrobium sp.]